MASQQIIRKLAAILYADVKGYSRMMGSNDVMTVSTITHHRQLFHHAVNEFNGRIVNAPGDSILAEFQSSIDAVGCAVHIQQKIYEENRNIPEDQKMEFRISVNIGDVIHRESDIYGDGVNIAARVEALTPVGGVCITRSVYDQVKNVLSDYTYNDLGKQHVKNIKDPVWIYAVLPPASSEKSTGDMSDYKSSTQTTSKHIGVAVLPFDNFSGEKINDYFSRGFMEDLITDLAHFNTLHVISSYTSRKISAQARDELEVAREIGIHYLLKGGLIRTKDQIRINLQLIETRSGRLLWAEKYGAPVDDLFEIQDDIVQSVVSSISFHIDKNILQRSRKKSRTNLAAYDLWLQGIDLLQQGSKTSDKNARKLFRQAIDIDPYFSRAYTGISQSYFNEWSCQVTDQWDYIGSNAYSHAKKAITLDPTDHVAQLVVGRILMYRQEFDMAEAHIDTSLNLNSNDADNLVKIASVKAMLGKPEQGEQLYQRALRLNPYRNLWYHTYGAIPYFVQHKYEQCIETALKGPLTEEWVDLPAFLAASFIYLDKNTEARQYLNVFINAFTEKVNNGKRPDADEVVSWLRLANPFKNKNDIDHYVFGVEKAGLLDALGSSSFSSTIESRKPFAQTRNVFKKQDQVWQIEFDEKKVQIKSVKGFFDIAHLLACPEKDIHCTVLMGATSSFTKEPPVIDEKAKNEYHQRLAYLDQALSKAQENNDIVRAEKLRIEQEQLQDHLVSIMGLLNRSRPLDPSVDRSRSAVTWRIRSAIKKLAKVHPEMGRHLTNSISTGIFCSYRPEKEMKWHL